MRAKRFPLHPANPERLCWGCDRYCASDNMLCGNGSVRTPHPMELFGADWHADAPSASPVVEPALPSRPSPQSPP